MNLYGEIILDHFKNPHHYGLLENADLQLEDHNPMCGDKLTLSLKITGEGADAKVDQVGFEGSGCAISMASASILTDEIVGKSVLEIRDIAPENVYEWLGVEISPARVKCALLAVSCLKKMIINYLNDGKTLS